MRQPGYYNDYPSSMVSEYYCWFKDLGYQELDILKYEDGSWDIIQYYSKPYMPCVTKWQVVLGNMKNMLPVPGFVEKYVKQLDMEKREFWDREDGVSKRAVDDVLKLDRHREEIVERAHTAVVRNPGLMERIAKNGLKEMELGHLAQHVPKSEVYKEKKVLKPSTGES